MAPDTIDQHDSTVGRDQIGKITYIFYGATPFARLGFAVLYLALCLMLFLGTVGIRWYVSTVIQHELAETLKDEAVAGQAGSERLVMVLVEKRKLLRSIGWPLNYSIIACLAAAVVGFVMAIRRLSQPLPAGSQVDEPCVPRSMLVPLLLQMGALGGAIGHALILFLFVSS